MKLFIAIGLLVTLTVIVSVIAFASFANASRTNTPAYNYNTPGYPNNQYGGYTYPANPNYPYIGGEGQPSYPYYPPGYSYPYGPNGERGAGSWGGE